MYYGKTAFQCVDEFHTVFESYRGDELDPCFPPDDRMNLRFALMEEELKEFRDEWEAGNFYSAVKELADLLYVVNGTAVEMGLDGDDIVNLVHQSNLTKLGEDGKPIFRDDGKVLKGPNYQPVTDEMVEQWLFAYV